jgi:putative endonuclease
VAAAFLAAKGYRILARRERTRAGEIDLIAVRGKRLAFIEVKRRPTLEEAEASLAPRQQARIRDAALLWIARQPRYQSHEICFDAVFIVRRRWPIHLENGL